MKHLIGILYIFVMLCVLSACGRLSDRLREETRKTPEEAPEALKTATDKEYYVNVVPGVPIGPGKRLGGIWKKETPKVTEPKVIRIGEESRKSADTWQTLAKWTAIFAVVLTFAWYVMKDRMVAGAAMLSLGISFGCTVMAEIVTNAWILAGLILLVGLIVGIGYLIRDKSVLEWWRNRKKSNNQKPEAETTTGPKG